MPVRLWNQLSGMTDMERGDYLLQNFNKVQRGLLALDGAFDAFTNFSTPDLGKKGYKT